MPHDYRAVMPTALRSSVFLGLLSLAVLAPATGGGREGDSFPRRAPRLPTGQADWIGIPPSWESLRGHVVLVNVWTFG